MTSSSDLIYSDLTVSLYRGDARRLDMLRDESVGLIITSPPYNAGMAYPEYTDAVTWTEYWDGLIVPSLKECYRVLVPGGRACINMPNVVRVGDEWPTLVDEFMWPAVRRAGLLPRERITWVKGENPDDVTTTSTAWGSWRNASNPVLRATSEPIFVVSKGNYARESSAKSDITREEFMAWTRNTWFMPVHGIVTGANANPAQFPPELPRRLAKLYSFADDLVLDPFSGEGTTLRAMKDLGRTSIGVEISRFQCRRAANRCRQELLFIPHASERLGV